MNEKEVKIVEFVRSLVGSYVLEPENLHIELASSYDNVRVIMFPAQLDFGKIIGGQGRNFKALEAIMRQFSKVIGMEVTPIVKERSVLQSANPPQSPNRLNKNWSKDDIKPIIVEVLKTCKMKHLSVLIKKDPENKFRSFFTLTGYKRWNEYEVLIKSAADRGRIGVATPAMLLEDAARPFHPLHDEIDWLQDTPKRVRQVEKLIEDISEDVVFGTSFGVLLSAIARVQGHDLNYDLSLHYDRKAWGEDR